MSKAYYWLKLKKDFFKDPRVKKLRRIAGGDTYTCIYLQLLLLSLETDGVLVYEGIEPTFAGELSLITDEDETNIQVTLSYLLSQGLMVQKDNNFTLTQTLELTGKADDSKDRVRRFRERQKQEQIEAKQEKLSNDNVTDVTLHDVTCNNVTVLEKEKELELEKELETEIEEANASTCARTCESEKKPAKRFQKPTLDELIAYKQKANLALVECEAFFDFYESKGWVIGKNPMKDWQATMRNWERTERERGGKCKNNSLSLSVEDVRRFGGDVSYYIESTRETNAIANQNVAYIENKEPF